MIFHKTIFCLVIILSTALFMYQISSDFFNDIQRYKRIVRSYNKNIQNVSVKTRSLSEKARNIYLKSKGGSLDSFKCYNIGNYFVSARINRKNNYLPEFIRRGNGDVWKFVNSDKDTIPKDIEDTSAYDYCTYITESKSHSIISCGKEMFAELGYSGLTNYQSRKELMHPCSSIIDVMHRDSTLTLVN